MVPRRSDPAGHRDRRQARRDHGPQGSGAVGHPLRRSPARPARGEGKAGEAPARPRDPRDGPRCGQSGGNRLGQPSHAGDELRPRRPRRLTADEDHPRRRRPPRLPLDGGSGGPGEPRGQPCHRTTGSVALLDRPHGGRVHLQRHPSLLRSVRRHQGHGRMRDTVPRGVPARLRRRLVAPPRPDRHRQEGLLAPAGRGALREEGDRGDPGRGGRPHDRRQDAGRRHLEAVQGDGEPGGDARQEGSGAREGLRDVSEPFRNSLRVRYNECDPQGVVFNANYLTYFDLTMTELWRELGGYQAMVEAGVDMIVAEARVRYRAPLRFDDEFEARVSVTKLGETSMSAAIELARDGETAADGELRYVFIEAGGGATQPIPDRIRDRLAQYAAP